MECSILTSGRNTRGVSTMLVPSSTRTRMQFTSQIIDNDYPMVVVIIDIIEFLTGTGGWQVAL